MNDYRLAYLFTEIFNQRNPKMSIESIFDLPYEVGEMIYECDGGDGHKMNGYPYFTQDDPREYEEELQVFDALLLQYR